MKLTIYMKSGNKIKLSGIEKYEIQNRGNEIVGISLTHKLRILRFIPRNKLLVKTLALDQIEAITCKQ